MPDVHTNEVRSFNMSQIKGKNTKPEMLVRRYLHSKRLRFRLHDSKLPGKPDIVLPKYRCVVQVNGCFWHKHEGCKYFVIPKTRTNWWLDKINKTAQKDASNMEKLVLLGWKTIVVWECELKGERKAETLAALHQKIKWAN